MPHLSEELNIPADAAAVWAVVSDTARWPSWWGDKLGLTTLHCVELLDDAPQDAEGVTRRLHVRALPSWDERITRWRRDESITWTGVRHPGQERWIQQMDIIPGDGFVTLRWDIFYRLAKPNPFGSAFGRYMEGLMQASLERVRDQAIASTPPGKA